MQANEPKRYRTQVKEQHEKGVVEGETVGVNMYHNRIDVVNIYISVSNGIGKRCAVEAKTTVGNVKTHGIQRQT